MSWRRRAETVGVGAVALAVGILAFVHDGVPAAGDLRMCVGQDLQLVLQGLRPGSARGRGKRRRGRMDRLGGFAHSLLPLEGGSLPRLTVTGQAPSS